MVSYFDIGLSLICVMWFHWIGDFYCQTDYMARNKSSSNKALGAHIGVYTLVLLLGTFNLTFALINGIMHFIIDYCTSRVTKKLWAEKKVHEFFVVIGFDQMLHISIIIITWLWVLK